MGMVVLVVLFELVIFAVGVATGYLFSEYRRLKDGSRK